MPRLVTFGCSFVYGHGLPDCYNTDGSAGPNPSKFAWPQLLADKLGYECVNLSRCGSGNFEIFLKVLQTEFLPDDLVIIAWSFFPRFDYYTMLNIEGEGRRVPLSVDKSDIFSNIVAEQLRINENYPEKNFWDNWLTIHHCELLLNSKNIKNFSYIGINVSRNKGWFSNLEDTKKDKLKKVVKACNLYLHPRSSPC